MACSALLDLNMFVLSNPCTLEKHKYGRIPNIKNDRRDSGGTLRQKVCLIDI